MNNFYLVQEFIIYRTAHKICFRILWWALKRWRGSLLCLMTTLFYLVSFGSFPLFLLVLMSLIIFILWLKFSTNKRQTEDMGVKGHRVLLWFNLTYYNPIHFPTNMSVLCQSIICVQYVLQLLCTFALPFLRWKNYFAYLVTWETVSCGWRSLSCFIHVLFFTFFSPIHTILRVLNSMPACVKVKIR